MKADDVTKWQPVVPVELKMDKVRHITLDLKLMLEVEAEMGVDILNKSFNLTPANISKFLWLAFRREDKDLTEEQVQGLIGRGNINYVYAKINEAFKYNIPEDDGADKKKGSPKPK
jgi:hypothetical protein